MKCLRLFVVLCTALSPSISAFRNRRFLRPSPAKGSQTAPPRLSTVQEKDAEVVRHWLDFSASANATEELHGPKPVPVGDYRKCAALMNEAWRRYKESPCGALAHDALFRMRMAGERCSKLRWGADYLASYRELLEEWDTWCSKVECTADCGAHGRCRRDDVFPHDPRCHCHPHWQGEACDRPLCSPRCTNGTCVRAPNGMESHCECKKGFTGESCSTIICEKPCKNQGTCVAPDKCSCPAGWTGEDCGEAVCKKPCLNGGECVAPNTCGCRSGWQGKDCKHPHCEKPCENGSKCTGPNKCSPCPKVKKMNFTHPVVGNGTVITEGFGGPTCGDGPVWVFGDLCAKCVEKGGFWCLKDGKCSLDESRPGNETCPKSTKGDSFADSTPLIASKDTADLCNIRYRKCAKVAAPLVHLVNDPTTMDDGFCGEKAKEAIAAMKAEDEHCKKITIVSLDANIGHLNIHLAYERILQTVVKARKAECSKANKEEKNKEGGKKEKMKEAKKKGNRASWWDNMFR